MNKQPSTPSFTRLSPEVELDLARQAAAEDAAVLQLIATIPSGQQVADGPGSASRRALRTPYSERMARRDRGVASLRARVAVEPALRPVLAEVEARLAKAEALRWTLAQGSVRVVTGEANKLPTTYLSREDLIQEGQIGLLNAARRFDPDRGYRFTTYARWWVRAAMTRAIETTGRIVRLPGGAVEQARNLHRLLDEAKEARVEVTIEEIAEMAGVDADRARFLLAQVNAIYFADARGDEPVAHSEEYLLASAWGVDLDEQAEAMEAQPDIERLRLALAGLDERSRDVLERHWGLDGNDPETLQAIGTTWGVSRERTRQIQWSAMEQLRRGPLSPRPSGMVNP